jgi:peptide/nickel transport system substrate-binding protein
MKRIACCLLAAISWLAVPARGGVRPRYGGTLRVAMAGVVSSLDPSDGGVLHSEADSIARARIVRLIFDTLVRVDTEDHAHPQLAVAWQADRSFKRWQFWLRPGIRFSDGTPLAAVAVAQELASWHPEWAVRNDGEAIVIESETPQPAMLAELALGRNAVVQRGANGELIGTGAFFIKNFAPSKSLELAANENSWGGRPFVDSVQIEFGKSPRDQMLALQLGKVDLIELSADQIAKVESEGLGVRASLPMELLAVVATLGGKAQDRRVRDALSAAIDRQSTQSVLLRGGSEVAGGILPEWISGVGFLFPAQADLRKARELVAAAGSGQAGAPAATRALPVLTLSADAGDALGRLIAERVALNAREVGLQIQVVSAIPPGATADLRLARIVLVSPDPGVALRDVGKIVGANVQVGGSSPQDVYVAEKKLIEDGGLIPLFHLPLATLAGERVRNFPVERLEAWPIEEVWLEAGP